MILGTEIPSGKVTISKKTLYGILLIVVIAIVVGVLIYRNYMTPETKVYTYPESSHMVLAGNLTYPGFYAWQFQLEKGDRVELKVQASSAVNLYVVPDSAHQTWANTYYHIESPGLYYPTDQSLASSGQTLQTTIIFTAPSDGVYDLVALNTNPFSTPTVTVSGKLYSSG
jgi:hypothetical protein